ncbi:MAG TPA: efflux RND transporter permease subunit [Longimicrobiales bacterium]|nr:efflux RND transporter permease subunit [Longimicrobiales bacterium]
MSIPGISTRRPVAVWMLFLAVILLGVIAYLRLPIDLLPNVSYPRLVIYTSYPNVAPAEVERIITAPIEAQSATVPGVDGTSSVSREGVSLVTLRFAWGTDMDFAMLNVREKMDNLRETLPESATRPAILRVDPQSDPVMVLSVSGASDLWQTKQMAETVFRRRLEQLDGVAEAQITGGLDREIQVDVNPQLLAAYGVTIQQISQALAQANYSAPGGTILQGRYRYPLRTLGEFQNVADIGDVVVARQAPGASGAGGGLADTTGTARLATAPASGHAGSLGSAGTAASHGGRIVRLRDVAKVVDGFAERQDIARYDGKESVGILVYKEAGANTVTVARSVRTVLGQLANEYPAIRVDVAYSQAGFISDSISNVVQSLVLGGLLAFLVLFLFLKDPRYPVAIALSIPISVVATFALMETFHVSLNIMSLGGLALGVGMLVDNSIVVLENIFRHRDEEHAAPVPAAVHGAEEVQGAITASTLTTIAVFGPIVYVKGVAGELFKDLSLTVTFSLLASLMVALTLLPTMAARFAAPDRARPAPLPPPTRTRTPGFRGRVVWIWFLAVDAPAKAARWSWGLLKALVRFWLGGIGRVLGRLTRPLVEAFERGFNAFARRYHAALEWSLDHPGRVLGAAGTALVVAVVLATILPRNLLPQVDQGAFQMRLELPQGTSLRTTADAAGTIEKALLADPGVDAVFTNIGRNEQAYAQAEQGEQPVGLQTATFQVRVRKGWKTGPVAARARALASRFPEFPEGALSVEAGRATELGAILGGSEADIAVDVRTENLDTAFDVAGKVENRLASLPVLGNVHIGTERGEPQVRIAIDRTACASYGIQPETVAQTVADAMHGDVATRYVDFDQKIPVVVRYPNDLRHSRSTLNGIRVRGVPLRALAHVTEAVAPAEIHREDQARVVPVYADVVEGGLDAAIDSIRGALAKLPPAPGVRLDVGGQNEEMRRSFRDLGFAFGLALLLVYMILAAQFESFIHPFTILLAVPLAMVGVVLALLVTGEGLNTMSLIGLVILVGVVVNDAIVKVDFISQAQKRGLVMREAILEAGRMRLRPIIMTTVTTVLGLLPMALGIGRGSDLRAPLAVTVIGGISVATLLTLIVVPVAYQTVERARVRLRGEPESGRSAAAPASME